MAIVKTQITIQMDGQSVTVMVILAISTGLVQAGAEGTILNLSKAMICAATVVVVLLAQMIKSKKVPEKKALVKT